MGYSISYDGIGATRKSLTTRKKRAGLIGLLIAVGVGVLTWYFWNGSGVTEWMEQLAQALGQGKTIAEALSEFCLEILKNAAME